MPLSQSNFQRRSVFGFALTLLIVALITTVSYLSLGRLEDEHQAANKARGITRSATDLLQAITDAETAARAYYGTGEQLFIEPFNIALTQIDEDYNRLIKIVEDDNAIQAQRAEQLGARITAKKQIMQSYVSQRENSVNGNGMSTDRVISGKVEMDSIRKVLRDMVNEEQRKLDLRQLNSEKAASRALEILILGALIFTAIVGVLFFYIRKNFNQRMIAEQSMRENNSILQSTLLENKHQTWLLIGLKHLAEEMQGQKNLRDLCSIILKELLDYTGGAAGTAYIVSKNEPVVELYAIHAIAPLESIRKRINFTETWIGQVATSGKAKVISGNLNASLSLSTSIIDRPLSHCIIVPFYYEEELLGVLELGYREIISDEQIEFLDSTLSRIGITVHNMLSRDKMESLYYEMQQQAEELQVQQEELRELNEELKISASLNKGNH